MDELFTVSDLAQMLGVTDQTIKNWESSNLIPKASRVGLQRKRVWGPSNVKQICDFAKENGYSILNRRG